MTEIATEVRLNHLYEEMGLLMEQAGGSRMMGRVLGYLLVCEPAEASAAALSRALQASAGSISTISRQLVAAGLVERVSFPGDRKTYFRFREGSQADMLMARAALLSMFKEVADRGLAALEEEPEERRARLRGFRDFYAFMAEQIPELVGRWRDRSKMDQEEP